MSIKDKSGKISHRLIPPSLNKAVAEVLTFGAKKYKPYSWRYVPPEDYLDALLRHIQAAREGDKTDSESGMLHIAHALCNLTFLLDMQLRSEENILNFEQQIVRDAENE